MSKVKKSEKVNSKKLIHLYTTNSIKRIRLLRYMTYKNQKKSAQALGKSEAAVSKMLDKLSEEGYFDKENKLPTAKGMNEIKLYERHLEKVKIGIIRRHKIQVDSKILNQKEWVKGRGRIARIKIINEWISNGNHFQELFVDETKVIANNKTVSIFLGEIWGESLNEIKEKMTDKINQIIPKIEKLFKVKLENKNFSEIYISDYEDALVDNEVASFFHGLGKRILIKNERGQRIIYSDKSKGKDELEFKDEIQMEREQKRLIDQVTHECYLPSELTATIREMVKILHTTMMLQFGNPRQQYNPPETRFGINKINPPSYCG